jgi:hypothetical protein
VVETRLYLGNKVNERVCNGSKEFNSMKGSRRSDYWNIGKTRAFTENSEEVWR